MFNVGDRVRIVDQPYFDCPFTWVGAMTEYCGMEVTITEAGYGIAEWVPEVYGYRVDDMFFVWCENCFAQIEQDFPVASFDEIIDLYS